MRAALEETERSVAFDFALRTATSLPTPAHAAIAVTAAAHAAAAARATPTPSETTAAAANSLLRQCAHVKGSGSCSFVLGAVLFQ